MIAQTTDFRIGEVLGAEIRQWRTRALVIGIIGLVLLAIGWFVSPAQFYRSYLWSYLYIAALAGGSLAWLMLQYVTHGAWGIIIRRPCEAAARTIPLVALLWIPIAIGIPSLYHWSHADAVAADTLLRNKTPYLNVPFFLIRAAIYLGGWMLLSRFFNRWSDMEDRVGPEPAQTRMGRMAGPGLVFWGFSVTFLAIDWVLSINPHWFSTIYGLLYMASQGLTSMAFLIVLMVLLSRRQPMADILTPRHLHDLGKFLLALVMVWAYFSYSQFLIIWAGNLPEEIPWYLTRLRHGWQFVAILLVLGHFALPFALLLSRDLKRNFKLLAGIAVFILCMRLVDLYWLVSPEFRKQSFGLSWMDLVAPVGLIGIWVAYFLTQLEKRPLLPLRVPHLEEALEHGRE